MVTNNRSTKKSTRQGYADCRGMELESQSETKVVYEIGGRFFHL